MTIEEKLKDLILTRYKSIREFTQLIDIPNSTMASILNRGVNNASVGNVIKICKALHISADALANGEIKYNYEMVSSPSSVEVKDIINDAKSKLAHTETLTINGRIVDIEIVDPIIEALDIGYEMTKKKTKIKTESTEKA